MKQPECHICFLLLLSSVSQLSPFCLCVKFSFWQRSMGAFTRYSEIEILRMKTGIFVFGIQLKIWIWKQQEKISLVNGQLIKEKQFRNYRPYYSVLEPLREKMQSKLSFSMSLYKLYKWAHNSIKICTSNMFTSANIN